MPADPLYEQVLPLPSGGADHSDILEAIRTSGKLEEDTKKKLTAALDEFAKVFVPTKRADDQAA